MAEKQLSITFRVHQTTNVDFDSQASGQVVGDEEFIRGVFQRKNPPMSTQRFAAQQQLCFAKTAVNVQTLIGMDTHAWAGEIKNKFRGSVAQGPHCARVKGQ